MERRPAPRPLRVAGVLALALALAACSAQPAGQAPSAPAAQHVQCIFP